MTYQITKVSPYLSNKPAIPEIEPVEIEFPYSYDFEGGHKVWISNPTPDKIDLTIPLTDDTLAAGFSGAQAGEMCKAISQHLMSGPANCHAIGDKYNKQQHYYYVFRLLIGAHQKTLFCHLFNGKAGPILKVSFNPSLLGPSGHKQLAAALFGSEALAAPPLFQKASFANFAKLTRLDIAIDCIGISVPEVLARHSKAPLHILYCGADGLETRYLCKKANKPLLTIYDKKKQAKSQIYSKYGDAPVTRIEARRRNFRKKTLSNLFDLSDQFRDMRSGYVFGQGHSNATKLATYLALTTMYPAKQALKMGFFEENGLSDALKIPNPQIIRPKATWMRWKKGCDATGIGVLI